MEIVHSTSNLYEAAFLLSGGYEIVSKVRIGPRWQMQFKAVNGIKQASLDYYAGAQVEARLYADSYRRLKDFVFSSDRGEVKSEANPGK